MKTKGWKNVFKFTFVQQVKSKTFIISTIVIAVILALIAASANIIPNLILQGEISKIASPSADGDNPMVISKVYVCNKTEYAFDFSGVINALGIETESISADAVDAKTEELINTNKNEMMSIIGFTENGFDVHTVFSGKNSETKASDCDGINNLIVTSIKGQYLTLNGLSAEETAVALSGISLVTNQAGEAPLSVVGDVVNTIVPMISALVLFMFIFSYSQLVAQSVALEKSSKIMEYLLTSIKPLAVVIGKVLAMCLASFMQFILIMVGGMFGFFISMPFGIFANIGNIVKMASESASTIGIEAESVVSDITTQFAKFDASSILVMFITFVLGFFVYALIAALAGASISKMEDLAAAMQPVSIVGVLGFYLAYFPQIGGITGENSMMTFARYLPISSPFILTSDYMLGKIGIGEALIAIAVLAVMVVLLAMFVAKVYENIVLHTGQKLSIKDMLNMSKK